MKLVHDSINKIMVLDDERKVSVLVIENQNFFTKALIDFNNQIGKNKGDFILSCNDAPVDIYKNMEMIVDILSFEINKRSLLNRLYKKADMIAQNEDFAIITKEFLSSINTYAQTLADEIDYEIDFLYEYDISNILKAIGFKFSDEFKKVGERIIEYMLLVREFEGDKCFILINIRNYINDEEINDFYKTILYNKLKVLVISANDYPYSEYEDKIIIDKDLCEICHGTL